WGAELLPGAGPLGQEKNARVAEFPAFAGFFFGDVEPDPADLDGGAPMLAATEEALTSLEPFDATAIEAALRANAEGPGLKPRQAFQPVRVAVTGSKVSPGLFESIELLGRETTLSRLRTASSVAEGARSAAAASAVRAGRGRAGTRARLGAGSAEWLGAGRRDRRSGRR